MAVTNLSYAAYDLDGFSSDVNGLFLLGNVGVSPTPSITFAGNLLQNGPDAVALFQDHATSFPNGTATSTTNLIDALVYDTSDADDAGLLTGFGKTTQYDENQNLDKDNQSIQRKSDGTYEVKTPTPNALNDGGGVVQKSITISTPTLELTEGAVFNLTFTTSEILTSDLVINYTLANGSFTSSDYSGSLTATIASGTKTASSQITLTDDAENEDIETLIVKYVNLDAGYMAINNNFVITVIDNDFTTSDWGTPLNPTYGKVSSTAPAGYYSSLDGKSGQALKSAITAIIADPTKVRAQNYGDVWNMLKAADVNPENNNQIWLLYTEIGRAKSLQQGSDGGVGKWNREHIYPQSKGGFTDGTSSTADGKDVFMATDATHIEHGHGDAHHLRPADPNENSTRNNSSYGVGAGYYNGPAGTGGSWRGDVARSLMYMTLRYNGLTLVSGDPAAVGQMGNLDNLIAWSSSDKPDDYEMNRNNVIYTWQNNRNPFIDLPELASYVYGDKTSMAWNVSTGITNYDSETINHTNPVVDFVYFKGDIKGDISIYNIQGIKMFSKKMEVSKVDLTTLKPGIYFFILKTETRKYQGKIMKI
jgi:endonuclease I